MAVNLNFYARDSRFLDLDKEHISHLLWSNTLLKSIFNVLQWNKVAFWTKLNILAGICDFTDLTIYEIADLGQICRGVFEGVTCPDYIQAKVFFKCQMFCLSFV